MAISDESLIMIFSTKKSEEEIMEKMIRKIIRFNIS